MIHIAVKQISPHLLEDWLDGFGIIIIKIKGNFELAKLPLILVVVVNLN